MAKEKTVTVVNTGLCAIYINRVQMLPDAELEISAEMLNTSAIEYLIARGELEVKDNAKVNKEVADRVNKRKKKDPNEGKTLSQLEDGGEF